MREWLNILSVNHSLEDYNETDSSLGSPKPKINFYDDFEPNYLSKSNLHDNMPLPDLKQKNDFLKSLSHDFAS